MYLCYIDESGTPEVPGNSSHFILAGISLPIWHWKGADNDLAVIMGRYGLSQAEFHTAWLRRKYPEQNKVPDFQRLDWAARRFAVQQRRNARLLQLQRAGKNKTYQEEKRNYRHTSPYIHLSLDERINLTTDVADCIGGWGFARLFAECIDKLHFDPARAAGRTIEQQAFEQVVSRFERYLTNISRGLPRPVNGLLVHDNNQTVDAKHTKLMRDFHARGTLWTHINHIIETPMFVNSSLTRMVQVADLCAYSLRRFLEFNEPDLFNKIFLRADRAGEYTVGVRHYSVLACACRICVTHG
jgi:hypothetical protein